MKTAVIFSVQTSFDLVGVSLTLHNRIHCVTLTSVIWHMSGSHSVICRSTTKTLTRAQLQPLEKVVVTATGAAAVFMKKKGIS